MICRADLKISGSNCHDGLSPCVRGARDKASMEELPLEETARLLPVEDPEATPAADVWLPMGVLEHPPRRQRCRHPESLTGFLRF